VKHCTALRTDSGRNFCDHGQQEREEERHYERANKKQLSGIVKRVAVIGEGSSRLCGISRDDGEGIRTRWIVAWTELGAAIMVEVG
jgi:hypothetical protein